MQKERDRNGVRQNERGIERKRMNKHSRKKGKERRKERDREIKTVKRERMRDM